MPGPHLAPRARQKPTARRQQRLCMTRGANERCSWVATASFARKQSTRQCSAWTLSRCGSSTALIGSKDTEWVSGSGIWPGGGDLFWAPTSGPSISIDGKFALQREKLLGAQEAVQRRHRGGRLGPALAALPPRNGGHSSCLSQRRQKRPTQRPPAISSPAACRRSAWTALAIAPGPSCSGAPLASMSKLARAAADACVSWPSSPTSLAPLASFVTRASRPSRPRARRLAPHRTGRARLYDDTANPSSPRSWGCSRSTKPRLHRPAATELWGPTRVHLRVGRPSRAPLEQSCENPPSSRFRCPDVGTWPCQVRNVARNHATNTHLFFGMRLGARHLLLAPD